MSAPSSPCEPWDDRMELALRVARELVASLDLNDVLRRALALITQTMGAAVGSVYLLDDQGCLTTMVILSDGKFQRAETELAHKVLAEGLEGWVVRNRQPALVPDVASDPRWLKLAGAPLASSAGAALCVPLLRAERVVGVLTCTHPQVGGFDDADLEALQRVAAPLALAVENIWLRQEAQRRMGEVAFLHKTSQALTASLELEDVLRSLMHSVREHFSSEAASVALVEEATGDVVFRVASGAAADEVVGVRLRPGQGIAGWVVSSGQPAMVGSTSNDSRWYRGVDQATGFQTRAIVAVPIRLGEQTIGVVEAINPRRDCLEENDLNLLLNVAALAASAIQNARHFTRARDAEQRYASLFENSADPILITDEAGVITDVNRKLCELLGYGPAELIGQHIVVVWQDRQAVEERLAQAPKGEIVWENLRAVARSGALIPFEVRATRVSVGARTSIQWVCHDLTERLELERVRQNLTNLIIHDLRNPLATIVNSIELIQATVVDKTLDMPVEPLFDVIHRSSERLQLLIDSILDLARLGSGQVVLEVETVDVAELVRDVVEQSQPGAIGRQQRLESYLPERLPPLRGDRNLLQRVLLNLLDNAIKFTQVGGEIRVEVRQQDAQTLLFAVSDTGPGIPPEYHQRIFEQFSRVHHKEARGTGLGLTLCKLAVEAHGGRIWVESTPGHVATFKFTLPLNGEEKAT